MKVEVRIDPGCPEPRIVIHAAQRTEEIEALVRRLEDEPETLPAQTDRGVLLLRPEEIIRIHTEGQKVRAQTAQSVYTLKSRLYELEEKLSDRNFVRISASELVNTRMILGMDFSLTGTIRLTLKGNITTYVSRRQVAKIKKLFER